MTSHERHGLCPGPDEPIFNVRHGGMKPHLLEQTLIVLSEENRARINDNRPKQGHFKSEMYAEFLFITCEKLGLGSHAKFLSLELLDRFMLQHITNLYSHVLSQGRGDKEKIHEWESILARVQSQVPLRVVSCCQIASKLTSHFWIVGPRRVQSVVKDLGHQYNLNAILQSELRVLETLSYKVMIPTPIVYIETILEILGHNDPTSEPKAYYSTCLSVLEVVYMRRSPIYDRFYQLVSGNVTPSEQQRKDFMAVMNDDMLLAVAIISVSTYLLDQRQTDRVTEALGRITRIPPENILDFATVIVQVIIGNSKS